MHPLLYEVNARQWLAALSVAHRRDIDLFGVPEEHLDRWEDQGITHVWLMGVWPTGPRSRAEAVRHPDLRRAYDDALPGWQDDDVLGSPYAVAAAHVSPLVGGDAGLAMFRRQLDERGIKLLLDFVPNHLGLDHPWVAQRPELFVRSPVRVDGTFALKGNGPFIAHGKDPFFAPWTDTAQVDYRRSDAREAMRGMLRSIADKCDGVRCDMSMLALNDVFARTWAHLPVLDPGADTARAEGDFWTDAIAEVKSAHPSFLFLAEVYWDIEHQLCARGFDYAYDKKLYDFLVHDRVLDVAPHLLGMGKENAARAHFLENHDEPRAAVSLPRDLHPAAALLTLGLPGMRFLHDGELEGRKRFARIQLARRADEPQDHDIARMWRDLLAATKDGAIGRGDPELLAPRGAWDGNSSHGAINLVQWQFDDVDDRFELVVVNLAGHRAQCWAPLTARSLRGGTWTLVDRLGSEKWTRSGDELADKGLFLDVGPRAAQLFAFRRV